MKTTAVDGKGLKYEMTGMGEPLLLIATGPIEDSFRPFLSEPPLAAHYRLIRYRQRVMDGGPDATPTSFETHAADAAALLNELGLRRAHVAGHSTGAAIALQLALDYPELVHSLVLLEPPFLAVPSAGAFFEKAGPALEAYARGNRMEAMTQFLCMVSGLDWETCRAELQDKIPGSVGQVIANADNFFRSYLPSLQTWQFSAQQAASIRQPILSVLGTETETLFEESHALLQSWFPQLETGTVEGVGHFLHLQSPEPVAGSIASFLHQHSLNER